MTTSTGFIEAYSVLIGKTRHEFIRTVSAIRGSGLIPKRGNLSPQDAAILLIGLLAADRPKNAINSLKVAQLTTKLDSNSIFPPSTSFLNLDEISAVKEVVICRSFPYAEIHIQDKVVKFFDDEKILGKNIDYIENVSVSGSFLHKMAVHIGNNKSKDGDIVKWLIDQR